MSTTQRLHDPGQSLCLDNVTRGRLTIDKLVAQQTLAELESTGEP